MDSLLAKDNNNNGLFKQVLEPLFDIFLFFGACIYRFNKNNGPATENIWCKFGLSVFGKLLDFQQI